MESLGGEWHLVLSVPTSNHNIAENRYSHGVPRSFPTSNHNFVDVERREIELYIVRFLHQTTTVGSDDVLSIEVVYRPFPTSNHNFGLLGVGCAEVVYRPFPTSNHNRWTSTSTLPTVVYRPFPTSNHNCPNLNIDTSVLYIVRFLHQTTTCAPTSINVISCISSVSYIKPQPSSYHFKCYPVVYRPFPTSNHNLRTLSKFLFFVVYRPFPTSNHNCLPLKVENVRLYIVRFLHQTTTKTLKGIWDGALYIVRFLHQTTTYCFPF